MVKLSLLLEILSDVWPWVKRTCSFKGKQRCLLVVDDNEVDGEFLKALVGVNGHECEVVNNAEAALSLVARSPLKYPIVFVDLRLPLMSGLALIPKIRTVAGSVHIVAVAGLLDDVLDLPPGLYIGLIAKPVTANAIRSVISKTQLSVVGYFEHFSFSLLIIPNSWVMFSCVMNEPLNPRANECDGEARKANIGGLVGLLIIRQAVLTGLTDDNPHKGIITSARDSVAREIDWRFGQLRDQIQRLETELAAANAVIRNHSDTIQRLKV
jgi:CheY-like chemotaxis protein